MSMWIRALAGLVMIALPCSEALAEAGNVTHSQFGAWQVTDFHDEANPGCSMGADGDRNGRFIVGINAHAPTFLNLVVKKRGWTMPAGTPIRMRAAFPDGEMVDLSGMGRGQTISSEVTGTTLSALLSHLTTNSTAKLMFAGAEPVWTFDLAELPHGIEAMAECMRSHALPTFAALQKEQESAPAPVSTVPQPFGGTLAGVGNPFTGGRPQAPAQADARPAQPPVEEAAAQPPAPAADGCKDDWSACKDNGDIADHYTKYFHGRAACKIAAEDKARYGTPVWPGFWSGGAFGSYHPGDEGPKTGKVTLIEPDAQFQNGFGAMVHSRVVCDYDLRSEKVGNVFILER